MFNYQRVDTNPTSRHQSQRDTIPDDPRWTGAGRAFSAGGNFTDTSSTVPEEAILDGFDFRIWVDFLWFNGEYGSNMVNFLWIFYFLFIGSMVRW